MNSKNGMHYRPYKLVFLTVIILNDILNNQTFVSYTRFLLPRDCTMNGWNQNLSCNSMDISKLIDYCVIDL